YVFPRKHKWLASTGLRALTGFCNIDNYFRLGAQKGDKVIINSSIGITYDPAFHENVVCKLILFAK
ncbi:MAG: hypothetical protein ACO3FP_03960, partial [Burkholderiales bacterium]